MGRADEERRGRLAAGSKGHFVAAWARVMNRDRFDLAAWSRRCPCRIAGAMSGRGKPVPRDRDGVPQSGTPSFFLLFAFEKRVRLPAPPSRDSCKLAPVSGRAESLSGLRARPARHSIAIAFSFLLLGAAAGLAQAPEPAPPDDAGQVAPAPESSQRTSVRAGKSGKTPQELANLIANPAAPVTNLQFREILLPNVEGTNGVTSSLQLQPVVPIGPFPWLRVIQLMKLTMPFYLHLPSPVSKSGVGDLTLFDLLSFKQSWGRWGAGVTLTFPTASERELGSGKWQAGPSAAILYTGIANLTAGFVLQNPVSFTGASDREKVNQLVLSPTLTYTLKGGWFAGMTDYNWTFNWTSQGAATIPVGVQVGRVVTIGKQPVSLAVEAGRTASRPSGAPNPGWIIGIEMTPIFSFSIH
jgi:hypothetical protein